MTGTNVLPILQPAAANQNLLKSASRMSQLRREGYSNKIWQIYNYFKHEYLHCHIPTIHEIGITETCNDFEKIFGSIHWAELTQIYVVKKDQVYG